MPFGGSAVTSSTATTLSLTGVAQGATICVLPVDLNGNATAFAATEASGSIAYSQRSVPFGTSGDTNSQLLILTNAASGSRTISVTATGDTIEGLLAFWYTGVGDVDNSLSAISVSQPTVTAVPNNGSSGNFTVATPGSILICVALDLVTTAAPGPGNLPWVLTQQAAGSVSAINGYLVADFLLPGVGTTNVACQYASGSHATGIVGFALQNATPGAAMNIPPFPGPKRSRQGGLSMDLDIREWF